MDLEKTRLRGAQLCREVEGLHLQEEKESSGPGKEKLSVHLGAFQSFLPTLAGSGRVTVPHSIQINIL